MDFLDVIILLVIAAIAGGIGQGLSGYSWGGCFVSIVLGFIGAWLGPIIAHKLDLPMLWVIQIGDKAFPIVWSIIGAALISFVVGLLFRGRRD
ncbi:MAG: hypothetical protein M0P71_15995 [Melioribacteraceae bacterium]|nr:hypothetical protein [Melioribacteraceae bacterium]